MTKLKKIVLFAGIGAIVLAIVLITSISLIEYRIYRDQFKDVDPEAQIVTLE